MKPSPDFLGATLIVLQGTLSPSYHDFPNKIMCQAAAKAIIEIEKRRPPAIRASRSVICVDSDGNVEYSDDLNLPP